MDIKKPQLGKVEAFAFVFQREFCNTIGSVPNGVRTSAASDGVVQAPH